MQSWMPDPWVIERFVPLDRVQPGERLAANDVPSAAVVDDDPHLPPDTLRRVGTAQYRATSEFEDDGSGSGGTFARLRALARDRGGERR